MSEKSQGFTRYLATIITKNGLHSIAELADMIDVEPPTLGRWLRGTGEPSLENLRRMAPRIGVPLTELMVEAGLVRKDEVGSKPAAPTPLPIEISRIMDILNHPDVPDNFKKLLRLGADQARVFWLEMFAATADEPTPFRARSRAVGRAAAVAQLRGNRGGR